MIATNIETLYPLKILSSAFWKMTELYKFSEKHIQVFFNIPKNKLKNYCDDKVLPENNRTYLVVGHLLSIHRSLRIIFTHNDECAYNWLSIKRSYFDNMSALDYITCNKKTSIERLAAIDKRLSSEVAR